MERDSLDKLKFDKRLRLRHGWSADQQTKDYLDALPDVSGKIAVESDEPASQSATQSVSQPAALEQPQAAAAAISGNQPLGGMSSAASEPPAAPADGQGDGLGDRLSAPPFKEV